MKTRRITQIAFLIGILASVTPTPRHARTTPSLPPGLASTPERASLMFIQNVGQFDARVRFQMRGAEVGMFLTDDALWFTLHDHQPTTTPSAQQFLTASQGKIGNQPTTTRQVDLKLTFVGANARPHLEAFDRLASRISYFRGSDPAGWRTNVPVWRGVRYREIYPGIDLELSGAGGQLVPHLVVYSGANPSAVRLRVEGANRLAYEGNSLQAATAVGDLHLPLFQLVTADGRPITNRSQTPIVEGMDVRAPFARQDSTPLNIAPASTAMLAYSTFLGGNGKDVGRGIAVDSAKNMYIVGHTTSIDFPTDPPIQQPSKGLTDVFVTKLSENGALVYSAYIGGSGDDEGWGIAVDETGNIHITGNTRSADFPHDHALQATNYGGADAFVTKIGANGDALIFSTYLGGSGYDQGDGIAIDGAGNIGVSGHTTSKGVPFPNINASQTTFGGGTNDGFIAKLSPDGQVFRYSTYLGGSGDEAESTLALDSAGNAYITGYTTSTNFPTTPNSLQRSSLGNIDAFVTKLSAAGERPYSTYLGGSGDDKGEAIAIGTGGKVYIAIGTSSTDLPLVANPAHGQNNGYWDAYMATINPFSTGPASLTYATYLGGSGYDDAKGIAVDDTGNVYISGRTLSTDFPTAEPIQEVHGSDGQYDAFVAKLDVDQKKFTFSTYLGGSNVDEDAGIAIDSADNMYVTGNTQSTNFPTTANSFQRTLSGDIDTFVTKLIPTYKILGHVRTNKGAGVPDVTISAGAGHTTTTAADGSYTLNGLVAGSYTLAATSQLYSISPKSHAVSVPPAATNQDFTATTRPVYMALVHTSPPRCNDMEPNNDYPQAKLFTHTGQPCAGQFQDEPANNQDDWFYLDLTAGQIIGIDLTGVTAGADYILGFYAAASNQPARLGRSDNPGQNDEHILPTTVAKTGRYYIRVTMKIESSIMLNTYVLLVTTT
jgi:hypothetical protein